MRFATFAAFVLPLAALAAPTPTPQLDPQDAARKEFAEALHTAGNAINMTIHQLSYFQDAPVLVHVLQTVQLVNTNFGFGVQAASRIFDALQSQNVPCDADQLDVSLGTINALEILGDLQVSIKTDDFSQMVGHSFDIQSLTLNIDSAVDGLLKTVTAGVKILTLQHKTVKTLFDDANVPVPPGFENS